MFNTMRVTYDATHDLFCGWTREAIELDEGRGSHDLNALREHDMPSAYDCSDSFCMSLAGQPLSDRSPCFNFRLYHVLIRNY